MSERKDWYYPTVCMPFLGDTSEDIVQSLISKLKDSVMSIVLEDVIFKHRIESGERYGYWDGTIKFQFSFQPNIDKSADFCRLTLNVGELERCLAKLEPYEQAEALAKKLANGIWELFQDNQMNYSVLVKIECSTERLSYIGTPR